MRALSILLICISWYPVASFSQLKMNAGYSSNNSNSLCSTSIVSYPDSTYLYEHGCEGTSSVSLGKWTLHKDTIVFTPFSNKTYTFIKSVTSTQIPGDSVYVTILDKNDSNITAKMATGICVANVGLYLCNSNHMGTVQVGYKRPGGKLYVKKLVNVFRRDFEFETSTANNFSIKLSVPAELFKYDDVQWSNESAFKLLIKAGKLVDTRPSPFGQTVFETYK